MKVPYQLHWLPASEPATALLVPGHRAEDVLRVCVELQADPLPRLYAVADGTLLMLAKPTTRQIVGVVRLRGLTNHLLIPVNAELTPPLLADESAALVKKRGLVILPGGRILEFNPDQPVAAAALMTIEPVRRRPWQALPAAPLLADSITEITQVGVDASADEILLQGSEGIGGAEPKLDGARGFASGIVGNTLFQMGKGLAWLGSALNSQTLAGLGAKMLGGAMSLIPSLSEKLMGAQEAMLRKLLQQFRDGDIDDALKHAMPLGGDSARGAVPAQNAQLPTHSLFYSLLNLLGGGAGAGSLWLSSDQTYFELMREYRKQADAAAQRGDFRRAAFIYARLLNDFVSAARVLAQGGLHRDAAILYEKKLRDNVSAAREWEAAGEFDRAIHLYRQMGDHAAAGDLLRRIGEEDRAVEEYKIAAARLLETGPRFFEAGELLRVRGQRPDLAMDYYARGWQSRPLGQPIACATRLVQRHTDAGETEPFLGVLTEAESFLADSDAESTATFFTEIARLAKAPELAGIADEAHDRALVGIAKKVKQSLAASTHGRGLLDLYKNPSVWPTPLIGDSQYALNEGRKRPAPSNAVYVRLQAGSSKITAVCQTPVTGAVHLGCENGEIFRFDHATGAAAFVARELGPILALAGLTPYWFLALSQPSRDEVALRSFCRAGSSSFSSRCVLQRPSPLLLATPALNSDATYTLVWTGNEYQLLSVPDLVGLSSGLLFNDPLDSPACVSYGAIDGVQTSRWMLVVYAGYTELLTGWPLKVANLSHHLYWSPAVGDGSTLAQVPLHVVQNAASELTITGLDTAGGVRRTLLHFNDAAAHTVCYHPPGDDPYRAFACVRTDLTACVHLKGIDWWRTPHQKPAQTKLTLRNPVAAFALPSQEVLIIEADGSLIRVPVVD